MWWRGQADSTWPLRPGVFRSGNEKNERNFSNIFKLKAKSRSTNCPSNDFSSSWLFLMQHYGLPTRLLDWTESPLIALYFAVNNKKDDEKDAVIYALKPTTLNWEQCKIDKILNPMTSYASQIFNEAFYKNKVDPIKSIAAVQTDQFDVRHLAQQSEFTIHGFEKAIEDLPGNEQFLAKIIIPASSKEHMRLMLIILGITRANLFPDLENLSAEIASLVFEEHFEGSGEEPETQSTAPAPLVYPDNVGKTK